MVANDCRPSDNVAALALLTLALVLLQACGASSGFVGSENFSQASLDQNREVGPLLADTTALATITATFERDWAVGAPA